MMIIKNIVSGNICADIKFKEVNGKICIVAENKKETKIINTPKEYDIIDFAKKLTDRYFAASIIKNVFSCKTVTNLYKDENITIIHNIKFSDYFADFDLKCVDNKVEIVASVYKDNNDNADIIYEEVVKTPLEYQNKKVDYILNIDDKIFATAILMSIIERCYSMDENPLK